MDHIFLGGSYIYQRAEPVILWQEQEMIFLESDEQQVGESEPGNHFILHFLGLKMQQLKKLMTNFSQNVPPHIWMFENVWKSYHSSLKISSIAVKLGPLTHSLCANQSNEYIVKSACMGHGACGHLYVINGLHGSKKTNTEILSCFLVEIS